MLKLGILMLTLPVCVFAGVAHFTYELDNFWFHAGTKTVVCVLYAAIALMYRQRLVATALILGAAGDFLLAVDSFVPDKLIFFFVGASVFLLSHVVYLVYAIALDRKLRPLYIVPYAVIGGGFVIASEFIFDTETNAVIPTYVTFLVLMGWRTGCLPKRGPADWMIAVAGALFEISDFVLGIRIFLAPGIPHGRLITMTTYWSAQTLFLLQAVLRARQPGLKTKAQ